LEYEFLGCARAADQSGKAIGQIANSEYPAAVLALRATDLLVPDALLDLDRGGREVYVLPLQPQDF
jgi:hypothetical protein